VSSRARAVRVIGCGALCGAGRGLEAFWEALCQAAPGQAPHDLGDTRLGERAYVRIPEPRRDPQDDLAALFLRLACEDALAAARPSLASLERPRVMLLTGSSLGGMTVIERQQRRQAAPDGRAGEGLPTPPLGLWRGLYDGPSAAVGHEFATAGAWAINTACSSAANALGLARRWLLLGRCDVALVAGYDVVSPFVFAGFQALAAIDPQPSAPFCAGRRGLNLGEAAVAFVVVRSESAPSAGAVDLVGYGSSCDAHHLTRPDLSGKGLARAIDAALADAEMPAEHIRVISAHGTGTPFNDTMEAAAFKAVLGEQAPPLHVAKPVFGHTLGAAGAVDALAMVQALQRGSLPRSYGRGEPDPALPLHPSRNEIALPKSAVALSTSSGFGGSNAALIFARGDA
jgi:3-oxoacyl-[acyl-carrier-protein] synthase II